MDVARVPGGDGLGFRPGFREPSLPFEKPTPFGIRPADGRSAMVHTGFLLPSYSFSWARTQPEPGLHLWQHTWNSATHEQRKATMEMETHRGNGPQSHRRRLLLVHMHAWIHAAFSFSLSFETEQPFERTNRYDSTSKQQVKTFFQVPAEYTGSALRSLYSLFPAESLMKLAAAGLLRTVAWHIVANLIFETRACMFLVYLASKPRFFGQEDRAPEFASALRVGGQLKAVEGGRLVVAGGDRSVSIYVRSLLDGEIR
nr:uncharacterized protein LOC117858897 [Setaria viridis]